MADPSPRHPTQRTTPVPVSLPLYGRRHLAEGEPPVTRAPLVRHTGAPWPAGHVLRHANHARTCTHHGRADVPGALPSYRELEQSDGTVALIATTQCQCGVGVAREAVIGVMDLDEWWRRHTAATGVERPAPRPPTVVTTYDRNLGADHL